MLAKSDSGVVLIPRNRIARSQPGKVRPTRFTVPNEPRLDVVAHRLAGTVLSKCPH